jgi:hypothetical protein
LYIVFSRSDDSFVGITLFLKGLGTLVLSVWAEVFSSFFARVSCFLEIGAIEAFIGLLTLSGFRSKSKIFDFKYE